MGVKSLASAVVFLRGNVEYLYPGRLPITRRYSGFGVLRYPVKSHHGHRQRFEVGKDGNSRRVGRARRVANMGHALHQEAFAEA